MTRSRSLAALLLRIRPALLGQWIKRLLRWGRVEVQVADGRFWVDMASNFGIRVTSAEGYEPETKALVSFFREIKPALGVWYHQDLNIISPGVGFEGEIRSRYGAITGLPMKRITGGTYTGVAATWQKRGLKNSMAFVVELGKTLNTDEAKVHAGAVLDISMMLRDASSSKLGK